MAVAQTVWAQQPSYDEHHIVQFINTARARASLPPLAHDPRLSAVARGHSYDMASNWFFGHDSPTTGDIYSRLNRAKVPYNAATQNIAIATSPHAAHKSLMRNSANRAALLSPAYTHLGVGVVRVGLRLMVTENLISAGIPRRISPWASNPVSSPWIRVAPQASSQPPALVQNTEAPVEAQEPRPRRRRRRTASPQECSLEGEWRGTAPAGMLRGNGITFTFWNNGTARGSSGSISLNSRWSREGNLVTINDIDAHPSYAACPASQTGRYTLSFSQDCRSVHVVDGGDICRHRNQTLAGLQARRVR